MEFFLQLSQTTPTAESVFEIYSTKHEPDVDNILFVVQYQTSAFQSSHSEVLKHNDIYRHNTSPKFQLDMYLTYKDFVTLDTG